MSFSPESCPSAASLRHHDLCKWMYGWMKLFFAPWKNNRNCDTNRPVKLRRVWTAFALRLLLLTKRNLHLEFKVTFPLPGMLHSDTVLRTRDYHVWQFGEPAW